VSILKIKDWCNFWDSRDCRAERESEYRRKETQKETQKHNKHTQKNTEKSSSLH